MAQQTWTPPCGCRIVQRWDNAVLPEFRDFSNAKILAAEGCKDHQFASPQDIHDAVCDEHQLVAQVQTAARVALKDTHAFTDPAQLEILAFLGHDTTSPIYKAGHEPVLTFNAKRALVVAIPTFADPVKTAAADAAHAVIAKLDPRVVMADPDVAITVKP